MKEMTRIQLNNPISALGIAPEIAYRTESGAIIRKSGATAWGVMYTYDSGSCGQAHFHTRKQAAEFINNEIRNGGEVDSNGILNLKAGK
jgi:hypothetical protein